MRTHNTLHTTTRQVLENPLEKKAGVNYGPPGTNAHTRTHTQQCAHMLGAGDSSGEEGRCELRPPRHQGPHLLRG